MKLFNILILIVEYFENILAAILGSISIQQTNHLKNRILYIKTNIQQDKEYIPNIKELQPILDRHIDIVRDDWENYKIENIVTFKKRNRYY